MRKALMGGALAVALWGVPALAEEGAYSQASDAPTATTKLSTPAGETTVTAPAGSEVVTPSQSSEYTEPSLDQRTAMPPADGSEEKNTTIIVNPPPAAPAPAPVVAVPPAPVKKEEKNDMRGLTVLLGGGVEGYTGDFAPGIRPGPSWGVTAAIKPSKVLGLELGYSGAVNELRGVNAASGPDLVRNGGQAVATLGLTSTAFQPYLLGGVGINKYDVRGAAPAAGYNSDISGNIPLGGGLRTHVGHFTADARFDYNVLIDNDLTAVGGTNIGGADTSLGAGGRYQGMLQIGSTF